MPRSTCLTCHRLIAHGESYCSAHTRQPRRSTPKVSPRKRGLTHAYEKNRGVVLSLSRVCVLCSKPGANSADHVIPRKHGGDNSLYNLVPAHLACNSRRGAKPLSPEQTTEVVKYRGILAAFAQTKRIDIYTA